MVTSNYICTAHTIPGQHIRGYPKSTGFCQEDILHISVKQYTPLDYQDSNAPPGAVTIIAAHANGFPKELYEPLWDDLYTEFLTVRGMRIRNIWIADMVNQGASGVINEGIIGNDRRYLHLFWAVITKRETNQYCFLTCALDHARDLLLMVNHFRDQMVRPIFGLGHSIGGTVIVNLALLHPRVITGVICIEPIINETAPEVNIMGALLMTVKKNRWASREEAEKYFHAKNPWKRWDERALKLWNQYAIRRNSSRLPREIEISPTKATHADQVESVESHSYTLTTSVSQEVLTYARAAYPQKDEESSLEFNPTLRTHPDLGGLSDRDCAAAFYIPSANMTFTHLQYLRPRYLYVYGSCSVYITASDQGKEDKRTGTGIATGGNGGYVNGAVQESVIANASHLSPFEMPRQLSDVVPKWLNAERRRWEEDESLDRVEQEKISPRMRSVVDDSYRRRMNEQFGQAMENAQKKDSKNNHGRSRL